MPILFIDTKIVSEHQHCLLTSIPQRQESTK